MLKIMINTASERVLFLYSNRLTREPNNAGRRVTGDHLKSLTGKGIHMKTDFLKELGLAQDAIDKIMAENGKDIAAEQAKTTAKTGELATANQTIKDLQATVKQFDGVDIGKLKRDVADWETKYNTDIAAEKTKADNIQKEYGLKDALKAMGAVDPEYLIYKHGGVEKFAFGTDGKPIGLDDITKPYKESSPQLFAPTGKAAVPQTRTGMRQTGAEASNEKKDEANAAFRSIFGKG